MDMYSLGVLLFVMLTGCKPIPSAICTKLSYDRLETADYPGVKMQQFRRLSAPARELVLALMARRPADRPCAMATLAHPWVHTHAERWRAAGIDLSELALPAAELNDAVRRAPRVDELVARARAQRPLPPSAGSKARGADRSSRAATPTQRSPHVDVSERGTPPAQSTAGAIAADGGQENMLAGSRHRHRSRHTTPTATDTPTSPAPVTSGIPARPPLARQGSSLQSTGPTATSPLPRHARVSAGVHANTPGASGSMHVQPSGSSLTAGHSVGHAGGEPRNRGTPLRRDISNALSDTIDNILDLIQQQSGTGTTSACAPAGTPCGSAFTGPLTPAMHPGVWGSQYGGLGRMRSRSGSLPMPNGDSTQIQGGSSSFVMMSAIPNAPVHEVGAAVSTTPGGGNPSMPLSPAHGMVESMSGKVSAVPSRSINRALSAVFHAAESVADADYVRPTSAACIIPSGCRPE